MAESDDSPGLVVEGFDPTFTRYWATGKHHRRRKAEAAQAWPGFLEFWAAHPVKTGKLRAWEAWLKHMPPAAECVAALEWQRDDQSRAKDNYEFFKRPEAWLNAASWEDAPPEAGTTSVKEIPKGLRGVYQLMREREEDAQTQEGGSQA